MMLSMRNWVVNNNMVTFTLCSYVICDVLITRPFMLIETWSTTQENSTTTFHMALAWLSN
jgi:L-ribulose-5-phosphate 3-epimerase UlaE